MKKYLFEAARFQLEKPTEPKSLFCTTAKAAVYAEDQASAQALAQEKLRKEYYGTGVRLGQVRYVAEYDLPVDWSYGYGSARKSGPTRELGDLVGNHVIR